MYQLFALVNFTGIYMMEIAYTKKLYSGNQMGFGFKSGVWY